MALYLTPATITDMGDTLGQDFAEGELNSLQDVLRHAAGTMSTQVELAVAAGLADEDVDAMRDTSSTLTMLADAIEAGEKTYREES